MYKIDESFRQVVETKAIQGYYLEGLTGTNSAVYMVQLLIDRGSQTVRNNVRTTSTGSSHTIDQVAVFTKSKEVKLAQRANDGSYDDFLRVAKQRVQEFLAPF